MGEAEMAVADRTAGGASSGGGESGSAPSIDDLARQIRELHASGGKMPAERALAERFGVARYTLRRALQLLREQNEIPEARPRSRGRGTKTRHEDLVSVTNPVEVAELRRMIEPVFAKLAAMRATPSDIAAMQKGLERDGKGPDLHRIIAQATGNALAAEIYGLLRQIESDARLGIRAETGAESTAHQRALVEAIATRSPDKASAAMSDTLSEIYRRTLGDIV